MKISLRKFNESDIPNKVKWINDSANNRFLHYDLPLTEEKTAVWYEKIKDSDTRYDAVIEVDGEPVGLLGLLSIDRKNKKAEYYISMGNTSFKGCGVATEALRLLLEYAFCELGLNRVYSYTETENIPAHRHLEKLGFLREGCTLQDVFSRGKFVDRYIYGLTKDGWKK